MLHDCGLESACLPSRVVQHQMLSISSVNPFNLTKSNEELWKFTINRS